MLEGPLCFCACRSRSNKKDEGSHYHIPNTILGFSFFPSVSCFAHFQCFMETKKAQLIAKVTQNILEKFAFLLEKNPFHLNIHFFSASLSWGTSCIDCTELKTENLHLDRNLRKGLLYKLSCIAFFLLPVWYEIIFLFYSLNNDTKAGLQGPLNTDSEDAVITLILYDEPTFLRQMPKKLWFVYYKHLLFFIQVWWPY